jgi:hypothetical protein
MFVMLKYVDALFQEGRSLTQTRSECVPTDSL